jgi:hypothetical protein
MTRRYGSKCAWLALAWATLPIGCARVEQVQYFAALGEPDPATGIAPKRFYRMTLHGAAGVGVEWKMRAAYVAQTTLDTLNGKLPSIPEADLSPDAELAYDEIRQSYLDCLKGHARQRALAAVDTPAEYERAVVDIARQGWLAGLSDQDRDSAGQGKTTDPYRFRKLIFYATAANVNLQDYDGQITSALDKATGLARSFKSRAGGAGGPARKQKALADILSKALAGEQPSAASIITFLTGTADDKPANTPAAGLSPATSTPGSDNPQ